MIRWKTLREGLPFLASALAVALIGGRFSRTVGRTGWLATGFTLWFFRDPERTAPERSEAVLAPADGKVTDVLQVPSPLGHSTPMIRIGIFLSIFDVHVNRSPVAASIKRVWHESGEFLDARNPEAAEKNERCSWLLETPTGRHLVVRQLTGAIARRIVPWKSEGEPLLAGERFGMIRFGSRTEIYLPLDADVFTAVGHRVRAGETVVARLPPA